MSTNQTAKDVKELMHDLVESGDVDSYAGKRHALRIAGYLQLEMTSDTEGTPVAVSLHNVSETGCAFWVKRELTPNSRVFLREFTEAGSAKWIPVFITHCTRGIRGYLVGASFRPEQ